MVALGFNPPKAMTPAWFVAARRWKAGVIGASEIGRRSCGEDSIVAPRRGRMPRSHRLRDERACCRDGSVNNPRLCFNRTATSSSRH